MYEDVPLGKPIKIMDIISETTQQNFGYVFFAQASLFNQTSVQLKVRVKTAM